MKKIVISNGPLETKKLATLFKANLQKGDVVLLKGDIGAGKSHFARSLIQSAMHIKEEVPSPTFTLVQVYDTTIGSIWHADLYRLNDYSDVIELGLIDAFGEEIVLLEWPERLGYLEPKDSLTIEIIILEGDRREIIFSTASNEWKPRLDKILKDQ